MIFAGKRPKPKPRRPRLIASPIAARLLRKIHSPETSHGVEFAMVASIVNNVLDRRCATDGSFGPIADVPWPNVPGAVTEPRSASPGTPMSLFGGVRLSFQANWRVL